MAKDYRGKAVSAHIVPQKGVDEARYACDCLVEDVKWLGYCRLALRSDNENNLKESSAAYKFPIGAAPSIADVSSSA